MSGDNKKGLQKIEKEYKSFFLATGISTMAKAMTLKDFTNAIEKSEPIYRNLDLSPLGRTYEESLSENEYFGAQQNIAAVRHFRYMPAIFHVHEFFEIACVLTGTFQNYIGDTQVLMHPGDVFILAPKTRHAVSTYEDSAQLVNILVRTSSFEEHFLNLLPENDLLRNFFVKTLYGSSNTPYLLFKTGVDKKMRSYVGDILQESDRNARYKDTMMTSLLSMFFVYLLREHEKDIIIPSLHSSIMNENTIFILEYMQRNYATVTLNHLAGFFNYSERQMLRIIKTATGRSFVDNLRKIRMEHAAELLLHTNKTIEEISGALGYYDASNFRHVFKSYYNVTPQDFRKERPLL